MRPMRWLNLGRALGIVSFLLLAAVWIVTLIPHRWGVRFPWDLDGIMLSMAVAIVCCSVASIRDCRWWLLLLAFELITVVLFAFRV
jgi:hypothetical protein